MKPTLLYVLAGLFVVTGLLFPACKEADPLPEPETRRIQLSVFNGIYAEKVNIYLESLGKTTVLATGLEQGKAWPSAGYASPLIRIPAAGDTTHSPTRLVIRGYNSDTLLFSSRLDSLSESSRNSFFVVQENDSTLTKGRVTDNFTTPGPFTFNLQFANLSKQDTAILRADSTIKMGGYLYNSFSSFQPFAARNYTLAALTVKQPADTLAKIAPFKAEQGHSYTVFLIRDAASNPKLVYLTRE